MNVALSSRHTVHATHNDGTAHPKCLPLGAPHGSGSYRTTTREVTCKKCLKALATEAQKEAEYQDRLAASLAPATESDDLGYVHADEQAAADAQPAEIREAREQAEQAADTARDIAFLTEALAAEDPAELVDLVNVATGATFTVPPRDALALVRHGFARLLR